MIKGCREKIIKSSKEIDLVNFLQQDRTKKLDGIGWPVDIPGRRARLSFE